MKTTGRSELAILDFFLPVSEISHFMESQKQRVVTFKYVFSEFSPDDLFGGYLLFKKCDVIYKQPSGACE